MTASPNMFRLLGSCEGAMPRHLHQDNKDLEMVALACHDFIALVVAEGLSMGDDTKTELGALLMAVGMSAYHLGYKRANIEKSLVFVEDPAFRFWYYYRKVRDWPVEMWYKLTGRWRQ